MSATYSFGNVSGPVNTGSPVNQGGNQVVGPGSVVISGSNVNRHGPDAELLSAVAALRRSLDALRLTTSERAAAEQDLDRIRDEADEPAAGAAFESFLRRLKQAGALADGGADLAEAVSRVARWLGPAAAAACALL